MKQINVLFRVEADEKANEVLRIDEIRVAGQTRNESNDVVFEFLLEDVQISANATDKDGLTFKYQDGKFYTATWFWSADAAQEYDDFESYLDNMQLAEITGVAILSDHDRTVYAMSKPNRHGDVIHYMVDKYNVPKPVKGTQGFITQDEEFIDRVLAMQIARAQIELKREIPKSREILFSEDLW